MLPFKTTALAATIFVVAAGTALTPGPLRAQDGGLLDLLVRKGIITDQEAEDLRYDIAREQKIVSPTASTAQLRLSGDLRARYQYDNDIPETANHIITDTNNHRERWRYRLRATLEANLNENWRAGIRLETANGNDSTNQNFGSFFDKTNDSLNVGLVYLQYTALDALGADEIDFRLGKHAHPFLFEGVNGFVWDTDINPEGFSEQFTWGALGSTPGARWVARAGQYLVADNVNRSGDNDQMMFVGQLEYRNEFELGRGLRIAPTVLGTTNGVLGTVAAQTGTVLPDGTGPAAGSSVETNLSDLFVVMVPAEYYFTARGQPVAVYGTIGMNLEGDERSRRIYGDPTVDEFDKFFNVGVRYGQNRNKGNSQWVAEFRYVESGAYTGNLLDSDFHAGTTNGFGPIISYSRNFTENLVGTITWFHTKNIDGNAPVGFRHGPAGGTTQNVTNYDRTDVVQVDLSARF
jgi:hypothetical protein